MKTNSPFHLLYANHATAQPNIHFNQTSFITKVKLLALFMMLLFLNCINAQLPTITSFTPSYGPPGTLVTVTGTSLNSPVAFTIGGVAAITISNTGTQLVGLVMPGAITGTVLVTTAGGTIAGAADFTITTPGYPAIQQGNKLVGTDGEGASQGFSVSLSADGNTAIVGGTYDADEMGAAWVYTRSGDAWSQQGAKLVGTEGIGRSGQGSSVSLSSDGNTAIVGAWMDDTNIGAAWIFTRSAGAWSQQGSKLVGTGYVGRSEQGISVSLSSDGNTALVGGYSDNNDTGAAWIFTRTAGAWSQQGDKLVGAGGDGASQGYSVSLSADGNTAIIGGPGDNSKVGAAWIFTRSGVVWSQFGSKLVGNDYVGGAMQGASVSLSSDAETAIVGGYGDNNFSGAAWIFTRSIDGWAQQGAKLVGTGSVPSMDGLFQGCSASLSSDGNTAIFGGLYDNDYQGAAWVFTRSAGIWSQRGVKLVGTDATGTTLIGYSVAISSDGSTAIVGGMGDNSFTGAAWIYTRAITLPVNFIYISANRANAGVLVNWKVATAINTRNYEVERSIDGRNFISIDRVDATAATSYTYPDAAAGKGLQYYRIKSIGTTGESAYSGIVNLNEDNLKPGYVISPNPVENGVLNLRFVNQLKGSYHISLLSNDGRLTFDKIFAHAGGTVNQLFNLPANIARGAYQLEIIAPDKTRTTQRLFIQPGK